MAGFGNSVVGKVREINEDAFLVENGQVGAVLNLYAVADGMGGHLAGEVASRMAIDSIKQFLTDSKPETTDGDYTNILSDALNYANKLIFQKSNTNESFRGMGTTMLAITIKDSVAYIVNVGDSRLYTVNTAKGSIEQITNDHSYVMELLRKGEITAEEAENHPNRNIITRALGTSSNVKIDSFKYMLTAGDKLVLCTDGLNNMLTDNEIKEICLKFDDNSQVVENLLNEANKKGGIDNTSVILYTGGEGEK